MTVALILFAVAAACIWLAGRRRAEHRQLPDRRRTPLPAKPPARRRVREDVPHLLYVYLWAANRRAAYYGISNEPPARHRRHETEPDDEWWFRLTDGVMYEVAWYPNRKAAKAVERATIRGEAVAGEYLANMHHNPYAQRGR